MNSSDSELEFANKGKKTRNKKGKKKNHKPNLDSRQKEGNNENQVEEEKEADEDSDDDEFDFRRPALGVDPVELGDYDGKSEPQNGSQYLVYVMQETKRVPKIAFSSDIRDKIKDKEEMMAKEVDTTGCGTSSLAENSVVVPAKSHNAFHPSQRWRDDNLIDFSFLRSKVERWKDLLAKGVTRLKRQFTKLPETGNKVVWLKFCYGKSFDEVVRARKMRGKQLTASDIVRFYFLQDENSLADTENVQDHQFPLSPRSVTTTNDVVNNSDASSEEDEQSSTSGDGLQPLMSIMLVLSQQQIESLIYFNSDWLQRYGFASKRQGEWIYALLACIDKPVEPSTMGDIRNICKSLIEHRNSFYQKLQEMDKPLKADKDDEIDRLSDDFQKEIGLAETSNSSSSEAEEYVNALNLLIFLVGDYFGQRDLVAETDVS